MNFQDIQRLLRTRLEVTDVTITAFPPFIAIKLKRDETLGLDRAASQIEEILRQYFLRREVLRIDLQKERYEDVVGSLDTMSRELDAKAAGFTESSQPEVRALAKLVTAWASAADEARRGLTRRWREIADEKASTPGYDWAGEDRIDALYDTLTKLRQTVSPIIFALAEVSSDGQFRNEVLRAWDLANAYLRDESLKRQIQPNWDLAEIT